jgi:hypothetical protein
LTLEYGKDSPLALTLSAKRGYVYFNKSSLASLEDSRDNLSGNLRYAPGGPLTVTLDSSYRVTARNDELAAQGVDSVRTQAGLFYRGIKTRYWTNDWDSMNRFILEHGIPEFYEKRLNQTSVKQFLEENPDVLPPGLNVDSEYVITVRKK